ncbi:unnamed protein product [Ectocarpus sp. 6 AP-2014]
MGERKVLCKYFPPDFDPKKVPRLKRDPEKQIGVRMMIPFSMQCNTCGEFMYRGKKFNSLKEDCIGEDYLTIRRFRFYIKCVICSQEITFKTDPEKGDYELETGASRNFESWTDKQATEKEHKEAREEEEKSDNMKQLENRTLDSKIELEIMDALDEIKAVNRRHETVNTEDVLKASAARRNKSVADKGGAGAGENAEVDAMIANIQFGGSKVRRLEDADEDNSDGASDAATDANGTKSPSKSFKGKGKKRAVVVGGGGSGSEAQNRTHTFQRARKSGASSSSTGDSQEEEEGEGAGEAKKADSAGSALVSAIEAQARREAEAMKAAVAGSVGTKVVVKHKKKRSSSGSGEAASEAGGGQKTSKKRKKHKSKEKTGAAPKQNGSSEAAAVAPTPAPSATGGAGLGGLNLLGSYASSSDSDGGTT